MAFVRYYTIVQLSNGSKGVSVDAGGDSAVRTAVILNIAVEAFVALVSLGLMANALYGSQLNEALSRKLAKLRNQIFGPPPPTEEEIARLTHLMHVEAARALREAKP